LDFTFHLRSQRDGLVLQLSIGELDFTFHLCSQRDGLVLIAASLPRRPCCHGGGKVGKFACNGMMASNQIACARLTTRHFLLLSVSVASTMDFASTLSSLAVSSLQTCDR
jgi:hypothetical protein